MTQQALRGGSTNVGGGGLATKAEEMTRATEMQRSGLGRHVTGLLVNWSEQRRSLP